MSHPIPLVDLKRQYKALKPEIDAAIESVIQDAAFVSGKYVKTFEERFAAYCGATYCVGTGSATDALLTAYAAGGIGRGDEVITVANTFIASSGPLKFLGAKPVFVDVDPLTYVIDHKKIVSKITKKTKAIVPVHLYGQPAPMEEVVKIARKFKLRVIEDCAHAHGAERNGKKVGTFGDMGVYSFNPGKIIGAYGDAGCLVTNSKKYADFAREFINHGRKLSSKHLHNFEGLNLRMDGIQAAVLSVKLGYIDDWISKKRAVADAYNRLLSPYKEITIPHVAPANKHVYQHYVIRASRRDALLAYLTKNGIDAHVHYPVPLHRQKAYSYLGTKKGSLPVTEKLSREIITLPIFPEMTQDEIHFVVETIKKFFSLL